MPAEIRNLEARDLDAVAALETLCNPQPWSRASLESHAAKSSAGVALVATSGEDVIGYVLASRAADEAEVLILGVHPDQRRQGVAAALLRELSKRLAASGARSLFLEVRRGNAAAIALYQSLGFGEAGMRKAYYADTGEDALLLFIFLKN